MTKCVSVTYHRDRCRTTVNVFGDCVGVAVIQRLSSKQLALAPKTVTVTAPSSSSLSASTTASLTKSDKDDKLENSIAKSSLTSSVSSHSHSPSQDNTKNQVESTNL